MYPHKELDLMAWGCRQSGCPYVDVADPPLMVYPWSKPMWRVKVVTNWKTSGANAFFLEKGKATGNTPQGLLVNEEVLLSAGSD